MSGGAHSMRRNQFIGAIGALVGFVVLAVGFHFSDLLSRYVTIPADQPADRLAYAARWLLVPGLTLLAGIWTAAGRGFWPDAIEGTRTPSSHFLEINLRYNQNTVEQVLLAAIAWCGLSLTLPVQHLCLVPACAVSFALGRITFWIGYLIHPMARAFGMVITVIPTISAYAWLCWRAVAT